MVKRHREQPLDYEVGDGFVVINYNGKKYAWFPPASIVLDKFLNDDMCDYTIIHNFEQRAMFNVESLRTNTDILRQEINPLKYKDCDEWVKDDE